MRSRKSRKPSNSRHYTQPIQYNLSSVSVRGAETPALTSNRSTQSSQDNHSSFSRRLRGIRIMAILTLIAILAGEDSLYILTSRNGDRREWPS